MNVFTMIVFIVAICVLGEVLKKIFDLKKNKPADNSADIAKLVSINEKLNNQVQALETRVINLETIVTQEGYDLKSKINSL
ncbi:MAG: hypothetical protein HRU25_11350 [Psychrobium sp.]|nr:hypothetical protein [Psychrobium sp.]